MKIFNYDFSFGKAKEVESTQFIGGHISSFREELPKIIEKKNQNWVDFGEANDYPQQLLELTQTSAIHKAIVLAKATMQAGKDVIVKGTDSVEATAQYISEKLSVDEQIKFAQILKQINDSRIKLATDWQTFGAFSAELVFATDFSRVLQINHANTANIRSGKYHDNKVDFYFYSRNWKDRNIKPTAIAAYDENDQINGRQLYYFYNYSPDQEYYGKPPYQAALSWIKADSELGVYGLSSIQNGFSPSLVIKYYKKPANLEEQAEIIRRQDKMFKGAKNAKKVMTFFNDGKDNAADVEPISVNNIDSQIGILQESIVQQIISGHRVTSPMLLGVATPGKLGYSTELEDAYKIFEKTVIAPERKYLEDFYNEVLRRCGFTFKIELTEFNPIAGADTNESLIGTLGVGGTQALQAVIESPTLTPMQKINTLVVVFGITQADAEKIING